MLWLGAPRPGGRELGEVRVGLAWVQKCSIPRLGHIPGRRWPYVSRSRDLLSDPCPGKTDQSWLPGEEEKKMMNHCS